MRPSDNPPEVGSWNPVNGSISGQGYALSGQQGINGVEYAPPGLPNGGMQLAPTGEVISNLPPSPGTRSTQSYDPVKERRQIRKSQRLLTSARVAARKGNHARAVRLTTRADNIMQNSNINPQGNMAEQIAAVRASAASLQATSLDQMPGAEIAANNKLIDAQRNLKRARRLRKQGNIDRAMELTRRAEAALAGINTDELANSPKLLRAIRRTTNRVARLEERLQQNVLSPNRQQACAEYITTLEPVEAAPREYIEASGSLRAPASAEITPATTSAAQQTQ
ncbi:MAG: hypothetical protein HRT45_10615 [Bdellovibrionales bacterium]|nr:hypothetical protein [Bdellovibrionales bacterium]